MTWGMSTGLPASRRGAVIGVEEQKLGLPLTLLSEQAVVDAVLKEASAAAAQPSGGRTLPRFCRACLLRSSHANHCNSSRSLPLLDRCLLLGVSRSRPPPQGQSLRRRPVACGERRRRHPCNIRSRAFQGFTPDPEVIEAANFQPEYVKPIGEYIDRAVSDKRIETGKQKLDRVPGAARLAGDALRRRPHHPRGHLGCRVELRHAARRQERDPFARHALCSGTKAKFARPQLISALKILQRGDISVWRR